MAELGIEPKRSLGQNFLVSDHVIAKIIAVVASASATNIVEIGPGLGALTDQLVQLPTAYTGIELDHKLAQYHHQHGRQVIEADALAVDWSTMPRGVLVSNLPYQISSSVVIDRSLDVAPFDLMVLMFQKEVALRLVARASKPEYGMLSVVAQAMWSIQFLLEASGRDFWPAPRVASRVLVFRPAMTAPKAARKRKFLTFIKGAFIHPRRILLNNLVETVSMDRELLQQAWVRRGWDHRLRPQQVTVEQYLDLFAEIG